MTALTLTDLAARINAAHDAVAAAFLSVVERAIIVGALLQQAKDQVPHGEWLPWLKTHCPRITERTAQRYMSLAEHRAELESKAPCLADLTLTSAEALIGGAEPRVPDADPSGDESGAGDTDSSPPSPHKPRQDPIEAAITADALAVLKRAWDAATDQERAFFDIWRANRAKIIDGPAQPLLTANPGGDIPPR